MVQFLENYILQLNFFITELLSCISCMWSNWNMLVLFLWIWNLMSHWLQDILRLLTLWFNHGATAEVQMALKKGFSLVNINTWLVVLPQIIARIHSNNHAVRELIQSLLVRIGQNHPQVWVWYCWTSTYFHLWFLCKYHFVDVYFWKLKILWKCGSNTFLFFYVWMNFTFWLAIFIWIFFF